MHTLEPYYRWEKYYTSVEDKKSPFYQREYNFMAYTQEIYGYFIHPYWDYIGSETLYIKVLYANYSEGAAIIEMIGEWNDALHNDIMWLKRELIDSMVSHGIRKFILIGENVFNFHGSDDSYYEEWFEDVEDGWIAGLNFQDFVLEEWKNFNLDWYINFGERLDGLNWRTMPPLKLIAQVDSLIMKVLGA